MKAIWQQREQILPRARSQSRSLPRSSRSKNTRRIVPTRKSSRGGALATLGAFACFANPRPTVNLNAAGARLGGASSGEFTLHTGCSPLNKLSYGFSGAGTVGARIVSKSMSNDFLFEQAEGSFLWKLRDQRFLPRRRRRIWILPLPHRRHV